MNSVSENSSVGYILEDDLEYLDDLHEFHKDYPLAPEKLDISQNMLSNYCCNIENYYGIKIGGVNQIKGIKVNMLFITESSVVFVIRNETD